MTVSIVAHCRRTGMLGVAVATAVPAVGAVCPYVKTAVGAVSTIRVTVGDVLGVNPTAPL